MALGVSTDQGKVKGGLKESGDKVKMSTANQVQVSEAEVSSRPPTAGVNVLLLAWGYRYKLPYTG